MKNKNYIAIFCDVDHRIKDKFNEIKGYSKARVFDGDLKNMIFSGLTLCEGSIEGKYSWRNNFEKDDYLCTILEEFRKTPERPSIIYLLRAEINNKKNIHKIIGELKDLTKEGEIPIHIVPYSSLN